MTKGTGKRVTAKEVGQMAGVHPSTVSRIFNRAFTNHHYDAKTVKRVEECARALGYRPSQAARALRLGSTMQIGVVVSDIANSFFGQIASHIERHVRTRGYRTLICNTQDDSEQQAEHLADLAARHVDGIILSPTGPAGCAQVHQANLPLVLIDRPLKQKDFNYVGLDNHQAGRLLGEHLRQLGYRRIGIAQPLITLDPTLKDRLQGLRDGLGDQSKIIWQAASEIVAADIGQLTRQIVNQLNRKVSDGPRAEAVIGLTNDATMAIIQSMKILGHVVGHGVSGHRTSGQQIYGVAGIDDFPAADLLTPGMTVVVQPVDAIAEGAVEVLLAQMNDRSQPSKQMVLQASLITRGSLGETSKKTSKPVQPTS